MSDLKNSIQLLDIIFLFFKTVQYTGTCINKKGFTCSLNILNFKWLVADLGFLPLYIAHGESIVFVRFLTQVGNTCFAAP